MVEGGQIGVYRILKRIGEGGMGSVWLAEHSMLGRRAAIKVLHHEFSTKPEIVTRFFNEARAATAIADPGIVQIFDFGHHTDGSAYIVMELLDGEPLDQRLARVGALAVPDALRIMRQVSSTLGAAHARGIVHRDLKPENIFLVRDPEVPGGERAKVLDFGIAKLSADQGGVKTQTSAVMGTPAYMSPEQCRGAGQVDQRSDVYALGCVLFRLLCGRPPFDAEGVGELIVMHLREQPPALGSLRPGIPPEVEHLVQRCLAKDPAHRFSSGAELAIALGALTGSSPHVMTPSAVYPMASAPTTLSSAVGASTSPGSTQMPAKSSRGALLAGIGIAVAAVAFAVVFVSTRGSGEKAAAAPETSEATNPEAPKPDPEAPDPEAGKAEAGKAEAGKAEAGKAEAGKAEAGKAEAGKAEAGKAEAGKAEAGKAEAGKAEAGKAEAAKHGTPERPDPAAALPARMTAVLERFTAWARDHAGAPCPDAAALGGETNDPWGRPFRITCTDQPSDQIIGVISAGPDGAPGTGDDVASWSLGPETTALVRGPRWTVAVRAATTKTSTTKKKTDKSSTKRGGTASGIELDENGLPIAR